MTSPLEIAANAIVTLSILFAGRNSIHTWWTGIIGCALFALLFWQSRLYADVTLQLFFIVASAAGWWHWLRGDGRAQALPISRAPRRQLVAALSGGIIVAAIHGALLHRYTDAYAPFVDSLVLCLSVVAQLMLIRRRLENWPLWLLVNTLAVPLFASRGLYLTAALYTVYWINALIAWRHWARLLAAQTLARARAVPA